MCGSNPQISDFDDLPFDGDQRLITRWRIYRIHNNIVEMLNNGLIVDVYTNRMQEEQSLFWCINRIMIETIHVITEISKFITYILALVSV